MHKSLIIVLPLALIAGGQAVAQTPPTARCKQIADQMADAFAPHEMSVSEGASMGLSADDVARQNEQPRSSVLASGSFSKYDPINNRCYLRIYKHVRRQSTDYEVHEVYDAQIDKLLASAKIINGKKHGSIPDESYKGQRSFKDDDASWQAAISYMDELVAEPQK